MQRGRTQRPNRVCPPPFHHDLSTSSFSLFPYCHISLTTERFASWSLIPPLAGRSTLSLLSIAEWPRNNINSTSLCWPSLFNVWRSLDFIVCPFKVLMQPDCRNKCRSVLSCIAKKLHRLLPGIRRGCIPLANGLSFAIFHFWTAAAPFHWFHFVVKS